MQANELNGRQSSGSPKTDGPRRTYRLLGIEIDTHCLVDTGAPINVIDEVTLEKLKSPPKLQACNTRYFAYGEETDIKFKKRFFKLIRNIFFSYLTKKNKLKIYYLAKEINVYLRNKEELLKKWCSAL